jgi:hypothetical protein
VFLLNKKLVQQSVISMYFVKIQNVSTPGACVTNTCALATHNHAIGIAMTGRCCHAKFLSSLLHFDLPKVRQTAEFLQ